MTKETATGGANAPVLICRRDDAKRRQYYKWYHIDRAVFGAKAEAVQMQPDLAQTVMKQLAAKHPAEQFYFVVGLERGTPCVESLA